MEQKEVIRIVQSLYQNEKSISGLFQRLRPYIAPFHQLLPLVPKGSRVLDVGCGSGLWAALLTTTGQADFCYGFDASQKAIAVAERMRNSLPKEQQEKLLFECRSVTEGQPEGTFDVVTMVDVMHHIPPKHQDRALLDIWASVKPGGLFLYKDMASKPFFCGVMNRIHDFASVQEWIHYYPFAKVADITSNNGGIREGSNLHQPESCRCFFWYQHEWALFRKNA